MAIHLGLPVVSIRQSHLGGRFPVVWQLFYGVLMPWQPGQHIFQVGIGNGTTDMGDLDVVVRLTVCNGRRSWQVNRKERWNLRERIIGSA